MKTSNYIPIIGLEIHAELKTKTKMFCACKNDPFGAPKPNVYTCPVCLGMPGALPVANKKAIDWTIKIGLATGCKINKFSKFDRKHYFYPDLPKGYQISQYDLPFCYGGKVETSDGTVNLTRIHLEEDTAKLVHKKIDNKKVSLIDFNRSSVPLVEIVTEPDIRSGYQAKECGKKLRQILRYLDVANGNMEQGGMRLEANISLKKESNKNLPKYKVEIKNINSFKFLEQAINYEIKRQTEILDRGENPVQETRGWNSQKNITFSQRTKEDAEDYRYFPDPDLPPIKISDNEIEKIKMTLPELSDQKNDRWIKEYGLKPKQAEMLTKSDLKTTIWIEEILKLAKKKNLDIGSLVNDYINKRIKTKINDTAESVLTKFEKLHQKSELDPTELKKIITKILAENSDAVKKYQSGQKQVLGFLMGQTMKAIGKKVDPKVVSSALRKAVT